MENEMEKVERIDKEYRRLRSIYAGLNAKKKRALDGLIHRAAYMRVTLEEYEEDLNVNGSVELFSQSQNQPPYERERPVARLYNTMNKNYQSIMKQLTDSLPQEAAKKEVNPMEEFLKRREEGE